MKDIIDFDWGHWEHYLVSGDGDTNEGYEGFIYKIEELSTGRSYIGKKSFWARVTLPPLKGRKRKRKVTKDSNWRGYKSSCKELKGLIAANPSDFRFLILDLCKTKRGLTYLETKYLFELAVLESEEYFNESILGKFFRGNL